MIFIFGYFVQVVHQNRLRTLIPVTVDVKCASASRVNMNAQRKKVPARVHVEVIIFFFQMIQQCI